MQKIDVRDKIVSERLNFREITEEDFHSVYNILKDKEIMYAWGHGFSEDETQEWIKKN
ncbi:GNAT family N-acetyltransferase, partial [Cetobacterium sp.]|uniref:GNAT family N-acetyltransferase n=1 Tax=Cetobacterium sp. TaxID=2071632 RepID=UPI003EE569C0